MQIFTENGHLSPESLGLHVLGDLSVFARIRVEEHLAECGHCRRQLREEAEIIAALRTDLALSESRQTARTA